MNNNDEKLDEAIKKALNNYEDSSNMNGWIKMEQLLNIATKSSSLKHKFKFLSAIDNIKNFSKSNSLKWLFSPYFFVIVLFLCGAYFLYTTINSTSIFNNSTPSISKDSANADTTVVLTTMDTLPKAPLKTNTIEKLIDTVHEQSLVKELDLIKPAEIESDKKEKITQKEKDAIKKIAEKKNEIRRKGQMLKMENLPVLIKNIDSIAGLMISPNELNQKENKTQINNPTEGSNTVTQFNNADSIIKSRVLSPKDSSKTP